MSKESQEEDSYSEELRLSLFPYLPFISEMRQKVADTALGTKLQMMQDLIVRPKITFTAEKLQNVEKVLKNLMEREKKKLKDNDGDKGEPKDVTLKASDSVEVTEIDKAIPSDNPLVEETCCHNQNLIMDHSYAQPDLNSSSGKDKSDKSQSDSTEASISSQESKGETDNEVQENELNRKLSIEMEQLPGSVTPHQTDDRHRQKLELMKAVSNVETNSRGKEISTNQAETRKRKRSDESQDEEEFKGWNRSEVEGNHDIKMSFHQYTPPASQPPTNSNHQWFYESVSNIAFAKTRRGFAHKCLIIGCNFQTLVKKRMSSHLEMKHKDTVWNKRCNACSKLILIYNKPATVVDEYRHMDETHLENVPSKAQPTLTSTALPKKVIEVVPAKSVSKKKQQPELNNVKLPAYIDVKAKAPTQESTSASETSSKENVAQTQPLMTSENMRPISKLNTGPISEKSKDCLIATYKCMSSTCGFFTSDSKLFRAHLKVCHKLNRHPDTFKCACCLFVGESADKLIKHIDTDHEFDKFQCGHCFYRSCHRTNVLSHHKLFHSEKELEVIQCPQLKLIKVADSYILAKKSRNDTVLPLICVFCRAIFYAMKSFDEHIASHDDSLSARCIKCGEMVSKHTLQAHLEPCHNFGRFQCVYCRMGTNCCQTLTYHLANEHPSKMPFLCSRVDCRNHKRYQLSPSVIEATSLRFPPNEEKSPTDSKTCKETQKLRLEIKGRKETTQPKKRRKVVASMPAALPVTTSSIKKTMKNLLQRLKPLPK